MSGGGRSSTRKGSVTGTAAPTSGPASGPTGTGGGGAGGGGGDPCDLVYDVDLVGVRTAVLTTVRVRDVLDVALHREGAFETAVCRARPSAEIAGSLAGLEGLDRLLGCMRAGHRYEAVALEVERTRCRVLVGRVAP